VAGERRLIDDVMRGNRLLVVVTLSIRRSL
jgi:hypothetical protein